MAEQDMNNSQPQDLGGAADIDKLKTERDEYLNGWKRAKADLLNFQKDESKRFEEIAKFANEELIREVISVIDSLDLAFVSLEKAHNKVDQGLILIRSQLQEILKKRGVQKIEVKPGETYNPMYHEAIAMIEPTEGMQPGTIAEEVESGYLLHDYVLKPSRVKVVK